MREGFKTLRGDEAWRNAAAILRDSQQKTEAERNQVDAFKRPHDRHLFWFFVLAITIWGLSVTT